VTVVAGTGSLYGSPATYAFTVVADPTISITDVKQKEGRRGQTEFDFTVTLSAPSTEQITVQLATRDGKAKAGKDYASDSGTVTFVPGVTTTTFTVLVNGDRKSETNEKFFVDLTNPTNATVSAPGYGIGTIKNDDGA
jgi:hypothetical protein